MKKNQKTYLLLGLVLAIWGILGFQILKSINPALPDLATKASTPDFKPVALKERKTFSIQLNYRDPFLGTLPKSSQKQVRKSTKPKRIPLPEKNIHYSGLVNDRSSGQKIFFLKVDGQQLMLFQNQEQQGVRLVSGNAESVKVRYSGITKTIKRDQ